jgi:hypothetical protein
LGPGSSGPAVGIPATVSRAADDCGSPWPAGEAAATGPGFPTPYGPGGTPVVPPYARS